jgi:AbrB family looped-hinge helix DNA binding protein
MELVKITKGFRITIPKSIRESMRLKPGDEFIIYIKNNSIILMRKGVISDLKGKFKGINKDNPRDEFDRI